MKRRLPHHRSPQMFCGAVSWPRLSGFPARRLTRRFLQLIDPSRKTTFDAQQKEIELLLEKTPLFDADFYRRQLGDSTASPKSLLRHYIRRGILCGLNPNPFFFTSWYLAEYPEAAEEGNPLLHYLREGEAQNNKPNPYFLTRWYRHSILADALDTSPLLHYISQGWKEDISPNPCFDGTWYREHYHLTGHDLSNPFLHFLQQPAMAQLQPNPWFDVEWYRSQFLNPQDRIHPFQHYLVTAFSEKTEPNEFFDSEWYCQHYPEADAWKKLGVPPLGHYVMHIQEDVCPNQWFDAAWYRNTYEDITKNDFDPYLHFVLWGEKMSRNPGPNFNTLRYRLRYPDIMGTGLEPFHHFFLIGRHEGRDSCASGINNRPTSHYEDWCDIYFSLINPDREAMHRHIAEFTHTPLISVVMPVYNPPLNLLTEAIESVRRQLYTNWEFCIADDASPNPEVRALLQHYADEDPRIKVVFRKENGHISHSSNSALELATGEYVALLDHDDLITEEALFHVVATLQEHPDAGILYSDEDKISPDGHRIDPYLKSDYDPWLLLLGHNMISHFGVYRTDLLHRIGGFRPGFEGSQDYDIALRVAELIPESAVVHIPRILYHWRIIPGSTAGDIEAKPYAIRASQKARNESLRRRGIPCQIGLHSAAGDMHLAQFSQPLEPPLVSIIIPTRNAAELVRTCINSIIEKTDYPAWEIILVDNGSDAPDALSLFEEFAQRENIRLLRDNAPFNYSRLNNRAAAEAKGEVLLLLNNDTEVIAPSWLTEMATLAMQPGVGAVGACLLYSNHTRQHAGVVLGMGGCAAHVCAGVPEEGIIWFDLPRLHHTCSSVTGACLAVRKENYNIVGGLNEEDFAVGYNDVDFCLKLRQHGLRNVYTPSAKLYHHESVTRGHEDTPEKKRRFWNEISLLKKQWTDVWYHDPAYNPGLTLNKDDYTLAFPPRVSLNASHWPQPFTVSYIPPQVDRLRLLLIFADHPRKENPLLRLVRHLEDLGEIHSFAVAGNHAFSEVSTKADGWFDAICTDDTTAAKIFWFRNNIMQLHPCLMHLDQLDTFRAKPQTTAENDVYQSLVHASRFTTRSPQIIDKLEKLYGLKLNRFCHCLNEDDKNNSKILSKALHEVKMSAPLPASAILFAPHSQ
ncbi:MAG: glycosyltransferase family 2 protein [Desulforhopalus sp.]|nr:glycosyltransferase family 2 protein [Desulforhopalus sp.]